MASSSLLRGKSAKSLHARLTAKSGSKTSHGQVVAATVVPFTINVAGIVNGVIVTANHTDVVATTPTATAIVAAAGAVTNDVIRFNFTNIGSAVATIGLGSGVTNNSGPAVLTVAAYKSRIFVLHVTSATAIVIYNAAV